MNKPNKFDYLRYSGASINIALNPLHWQLKSFVRDETNREWGAPARCWAVGWLFLTVRVWIDDGRW